MKNTPTNVKGRFFLHLISLLIFLLGTCNSVFAQPASMDLYGEAVIGSNPTMMAGNLTLKPTGKLYLGSHTPHGLQTNTLILTGNYIGEAGSEVYLSLIDNTNETGTKGFIDIIGTANKSFGATNVVLDLFSDWDGSCIDVIRATRTGSDVGTFRMDEVNCCGRTATLRYRECDDELVWYIAEKLVINQMTKAQTRCLNDAAGFDALTVITPAGRYSYQWYKCNSDGSNPVSLGAANGAQTASYTPPVNVAGTNHFFCVITSKKCDYNTDTTDISGAITVSMPVRIINQPENQFICGATSDDVLLSVTAEGDADTYQWYKNDVAIEDGNTSELSVSVISGNIDKYYVEVNGCGTIQSETVSVGQALDVINQKLNNTLVVNNNPLTNGGYEFAYYSWYKGGVKIGEGNHDDLDGHYYTGGASLDPYSEYWVELIDIKGDRYRSCPFMPVIQTLAATFLAYPNPVAANSSYTVMVEVGGIEAAALQSATIDVFSTLGAYISRVRVEGRYRIPVAMPDVAGVYILQFKSDTGNQEIKIIVE